MTDHSYNDELWIVLKEEEGRFYLKDNSHTFPGRMYAVSDDGQGFGVSKSEIAEASPLAEAWIEGFLVGNEPSLAVFLGTDEDTAENESSQPVVLQRWIQALGAFRSNGYTPLLYRRPSEPVTADAYPGPVPWSVAGGEVWSWANNCWSRSNPQPMITDDWLYLHGSFCHQRDDHDRDMIDDHHYTCTDCGYTNEVEYEVPGHPHS